MSYFGLFSVLVIWCQERTIKDCLGDKSFPDQDNYERSYWLAPWDACSRYCSDFLHVVNSRLFVCILGRFLITSLQSPILSVVSHFQFVIPFRVPHFGLFLTCERLTHSEKTRDPTFCCCIWPSHPHIQVNWKIFFVPKTALFSVRSL